MNFIGLNNDDNELRRFRHNCSITLFLCCLHYVLVIKHNLLEKEVEFNLKSLGTT